MAKFLVTTDSGCDLSAEFCAGREIIPCKMSYVIGSQRVEDSMDTADLHIFYEQMRTGSVPKTSQLTPYEYMEFWRPLLAQGLPIVHISLGGGISGTWANGVLAAKTLMQEIPKADIRVIDSTLASIGYGMLAIAAADMRDAGESADVCCRRLESMKSSINTYYTTGDLTYLYRSGRVSKTGMVVAHTLNIHPILRLDIEGHLLVEAKDRGRRSTLAHIHRIIEERCIDPQEQTLYVCHSDIEDEARRFGEEIKEKFGFKDVFYTYIGTTIGSNCGPGLMAAFFTGKERTI